MAKPSASQLKRQKQKARKVAESARKAELVEAGLGLYSDEIITIDAMLRGRESLEKVGEFVVEALQKANILEIRKFFNSFGENKSLLVRALASSQNHDPRILLAVINDPTIDLRGIIECTILSASAFVDEKPSFRLPENRVKLLNSMACIKILSDKIEVSEEEKALLSNLFTKLGIKNASANSVKFLSKEDQNFFEIFGDYFNARDFSLARIPLISMTLFSLTDAARRSGVMSHNNIGTASLAVTVATNTDYEAKAFSDPITPYIVELVKVRRFCEVDKLKFSNPRASVPLICYAAEADSVLLKYLIDEGCSVDIEAVRTPLECAKRGGNIENIRLIEEYLIVSRASGMQPGTSIVLAGAGGPTSGDLGRVQ